jgi:hypothetical protein
MSNNFVNPQYKDRPIDYPETRLAECELCGHEYPDGDVVCVGDEAWCTGCIGLVEQVGRPIVESCTKRFMNPEPAELLRAVQTWYEASGPFCKHCGSNVGMAKDGLTCAGCQCDAAERRINNV